MRKLIVMLSVGIAVAFAGCAKGQSENCKKLIACTEALTPGTGAAMESNYGASGSCWKDSNAAEACTKACDVGLTALKAMPTFAAAAACK